MNHMELERIFLTGFMGSGKSTIGPILANVLGWNFSDLDKLIEHEVGDSVDNIFADKGESFFRLKESETLQKSGNTANIVLALGGGTLNDKKNIEFIKQNGVSVYLKSTPDEIFRRLKFKVDRPLLKSKDGLPLSPFETKKKISELIIQREPTYLSADIVYQVDNITVGKTVDDLVKILKRKFHL
ncbi:MAG: shikimate kinase [Ignavibacteria bacterium]|nr:shikimate kinase [Ignavibacteria bacterium]